MRKIISATATLACVLAAAFATGACAQEGSAAFEAFYGRESISAPLVRFAPNEPLFLVGGRSRIDADYGRFAGSASRLWMFDGGEHLSASARGEWRRSPGAPDLDFGYLSMDAAWRATFSGSVVGAGPTVQRQWVSRSRFRDVLGGQFDVARVAEDGGYSSWYAAYTRNRHGAEFAELDGRVAYASYRRHWNEPFAGLGAIDFDLGLGRERNANGFRDLDNRTAYLRLAFSKKLLGFDATLAVVAQESRFDAALFEDLAARRDHYLALEVAVERVVVPGLAVRVEYGTGRNRASLPLYELRQRQFSVGVVVSQP